MDERAAIQACSFLLARLEGEVARLREIAFPGHDIGPRKWLGFIAGTIETGRHCLDKAVDPATLSADVSGLIETAERLGDQAYQFLTHVAGADATQIPHQVVAPFQRWVRALKIPNTIFFRAEHLPNYELWTFDARNFSKLPHASPGLLTAISGINWPVLRVTVPGHAMGMLPHFAVVGHELGHAIQDNVLPDFSIHQQDLQDCRQRIVARLATFGATLGPEELVTINKVLNSWVNELKADAVGHLIAGPAFFFALFGYLELNAQSYGIAETHPPSDLRRTLLMNALSAGSPSFVDIFRDKTGLTIDRAINSPRVPRCPAPDQLFALLKTHHGERVAAILVELIQCIEALATTIFSTAEKHLQTVCPELIYRPSDLETDLDAHLELLCRLVPPIERTIAGKAVPSTLATVLNVGWAALLTRLDKVPETPGSFGDSVARKMERLHDLLLKGVELSEARRVWAENQ